MINKKLFFIFAFILFSLFNFSILAQGQGTIRGIVTDSLSGEALPFANILLKGTRMGASADLKGNFIITGIPANKNYTVIISYLGYKQESLNIFITANKIRQITVQLSSGNLQLETVEKIGEKVTRPNETDIGLQKMTIREIELLPRGVETDVFRSLKTLPGVQSTGDVSARYYVRGGSANENLVLLNGISVYNPFHALGLFSIIDPEMINAVEFYKGGFPADYGGRLSSVLNLVTKDGNKNRYSATSSISFLTGKAMIEGPIPGGSFIITGRKSLFSNVLKKFVNFKDAPFGFHDISFKLNYANNSSESLTKVSVNGFNSLDQLLNDEPYKADYKWVNNLYGVYWFQAWENIPIYSETYFSISKFKGEVSPNLSDSKPRLNDVSDITLRTDFTNIFQSRDEIKVGYELKSFQSKLNFENLQGIKTDLTDEAIHFNFYAKYKFMRFENFGADIGFRATPISLAKQQSAFFEPRINLTYAPLPGISLKGAWGIYTQELVTLTNENEIISLFEPWLIVPNYLKTPEATHYVVGLDYKRFENISLSVEGYYKSLRNLAEVNDKKAAAGDPDFVPGKGESYGWEFLMKYNTRSVQFSASYSLSWTYRNIDGWISYPRYDSRHNINLNLVVNLGSGWETSASWTFNSGLPFTQIVGFYDKLYFDNLYNAGDIYGYYKPYLVLGDRNLGRLPTYHRLDLSLTKKFKVGFADVSISGSILNAYNRKNIFYFERDTGKRVNMLPLLPTATLRVEL